MAGDLNFSVIIPACERPQALVDCLQALARLDYSGGYEVIVVDDASREPLRQAVADHVSLPSLRWERLETNVGPAGARNHAARVARGCFLAFTDDDCRPAPDWLSKLEIALNANPGCAVGGRLIDGQPHILYSAANQALLDVVYAYYNRAALNARFAITANLAVPADSFRDLGGFNVAFRTAEDREFCSRWLASGRSITFAEGAIVSHFTPGGLRRFWQRHYSFGEGAFRFRKLFTSSKSGAIRLDPVGFYWKLVTTPLHAGFSARNVAISLLICLSQVASALGFLSFGRRHQNENGLSM